MSPKKKKPRLDLDSDDVLDNSLLINPGFSDTNTDNIKVMEQIEKSGFFFNFNCDYDPLVDLGSNDDHTILFQLNPAENLEYIKSLENSNLESINSNDIPKKVNENFIEEDNFDKCYVDLPSSTNLWFKIKESLTSLKNRFNKDPNYLYIELAIEKYSEKSSHNFQNLKNLFEELKNDIEVSLQDLIPKMIDLCLDLPKIIKKSIPILKSGKNHSISFTQKQCSCILANSFFCTFPSRSAETNPKNMPFINFDNLFTKSGKGNNKSKIEKLKCIMNYFKRITEKEPDGILTFSRICVDNLELIQIKNSEKKLRKPLIINSGKIEDCKGALQLDFANKFIGGGVLNSGCVQEEIRFVICPELLVSLLFMERMKENECIIIRGCERFNNYTGYANSFRWSGNYEDKTQKDKYNRILTDVLAIDALCFYSFKNQFQEEKIWREIKKCFIGFKIHNEQKLDDLRLPCIATGNWGCGVFNGNIELKFFIQLIAATEANRDLVYFTFENNETFERLTEIWKILEKRNYTINDTFKILIDYCEEVENLSSKQIKEFDLYKYLECLC